MLSFVAFSLIFVVMRARFPFRLPNRVVVIVLLLVAVFLAVGFVSTSTPESAARAQQSEAELLDVFGEVFDRIRADYVEEVDEKQLIEAAIRGMLDDLDPHSSYLSPEDYEELSSQTSGEFGGLGIEITNEKGFVKVVAPITGTPAFKAGMQPGDLITHIEGESIEGISINQAVERMRGPVGTTVTITVMRASEAFNLTLERATIPVRSVYFRVLDNNIGYIQIRSFNNQTYEGLVSAMNNVAKRVDQQSGGPPIGYIVDLRYNPGGVLEQAVKVSDAFLERGEIVSTRGREDRSQSRFNASAGDLASGLPIIVLVNAGSASASEIVAGALQDHRRAVILGTRSFGKGTVQSILPLRSLKQVAALKLTIQRYYTPSGNSIQARGIVPDIEVLQIEATANENLNFPHEEDDPNALANEQTNGQTNEQKDSEPGNDTANQSTPPDRPRLEGEIISSPILDVFNGQDSLARANADNQLHHAVSVLKAMSLTSSLAAQG